MRSVLEFANFILNKITKQNFFKFSCHQKLKALEVDHFKNALRRLLGFPRSFLINSQEYTTSKNLTTNP